MTTGKTKALTIQTYVGKVMSLLFNTVSRFVIAFLPRSKCLLISWLQSPSAMILEPRKIKSITLSTFPPSICHEVMTPDAMFLVFWLLNFKLAFTLLPSSRGSLVPLCFLPLGWYLIVTAWLRLLVFLPTILISAGDSSSPAFCMTCSAWGRVTTYSIDVLLSQFWTSPFFHVQFKLLLLVLHRASSGDR